MEQSVQREVFGSLQAIFDYFQQEPDNGGRGEPSVAEFLGALRRCADGESPTVREFSGVGCDVVCDTGLDLLIRRMTTEQMLTAFEACLKGARAELASIKTSPWGPDYSFVHLLEDILTDGRYERRPQLSALEPEVRRSILNQLEQLAVEHERMTSELRRRPWADIEDGRRRDLVFAVAQVAAEVRGAALAVENGRIPPGYYDCMVPE